MWSVMSRSVRVLAGGSTGAAGLHVKVPFPFLVEGQALPAGEYSVQAVGAHPSTLLIRGEKGSTAHVLVLTMPVASHDPAGGKPALTFTRYETQYRLTDVWESRDRGHAIVQVQCEPDTARWRYLGKSCEQRSRS
jgi:hypothetical protein